LAARCGCLIHQDQCSAARYLALVPNAAADEGNAQGGEVLVTVAFNAWNLIGVSWEVGMSPFAVPKQ
jgi:hypothetical protein